MIIIINNNTVSFAKKNAQTKYYVV